MSRLRSILVCAFGLSLTAFVQAQGGVRFILLHSEPVYPKRSDAIFYPLDTRESIHFGFGYDHDLVDRLSMAVEMMFSSGMLGGQYGVMTLQYRSNFHFAPNQWPSAYLGTLAGYRSVNLPVFEAGQWTEGSRAGFPLGLRFGVRGGLEGFYADAYVGVNFQVGGETLSTYTTEVPPVPITIAWGVNMGVGWDKRDRQ